MLRRLALTVLLAAACVSCSSVPAPTQPLRTGLTVSGVHVPYATEIEISGLCQEKDYHNMSPGVAVLHASRINGVANQDGNSFFLYWDDAGKDAKHPLLDPGKWYTIRGHLTDAVDYRKQYLLVISAVTPIPAAPLGFGDFVDRAAKFEGVAEKGATLRLAEGATASAHIAGLTEWPPQMLGKKVRVTGTVHGSPASWGMDHATYNLIDLADMVDQDVSLEGKLWSLNGAWWFGYQGTRVWVTDAADSPIEYPSSSHGRRVRVTGKLICKIRPEEDAPSSAPPPLVPVYTIHRGHIEFIEEPITEDHRFHVLSEIAPRYEDGVLVLIPKWHMQRNIMGGMSMAWGFADRNRDAIEDTLRNPSPHTLDVLAHRMTDPKVEEALRLVYAAMLAAANDQRGRDYLVAATHRLDQPAADAGSVLFCLTASTWLAPDDARIKTDTTWLEPVALDIMARTDAHGDHTLADTAVLYSGIIELLLSRDTAPARKAVVDYGVAQAAGSHDVYLAVGELKKPFPEEELCRLVLAAKDSDEARLLLPKMLAQNPADVVKYFARNLDNRWVYLDFHDHSSPELREALQAALPTLPVKQRELARLLLTIQHKEAVPELLKLMQDPTFKSRETLIFEIEDFKDPRVADALFKLLRDGPKNYFGAERSDDALNAAIRNVADPAAGRKVVVPRLIELLGVDLNRFDNCYASPEEFHRRIASHLADLTDQVLGTDPAAWKKWYDAQPPERK